MATVYNPDSPPIKGAGWSFDISLISLALPTAFKTTVTLSAGDIQVSKDGGQYANLATFPPAERDYAGGGDSGTLRVVLTAAEMTASTVAVRFHDQTAPQEWADAEAIIYPVVAVTPDVNLAQILGAAITGTAAQIVAAFKKLFDVVTPVLTAESINQTGDAYARLTGTVEPAIALNTSIISPVGGTTTGNGAADGTTVLDSGRTEPTTHWDNLSLQITSGICAGISRTIKAFVHDVGFTLSAPFPAQIVTGVTYRVIAAIVYQPGIMVATDSGPVVEPDTLMHMAAMVVTNNGQPAIGDLTAGVIEIRKVRAGVESTVVAGAACLIATGDIYYDYTFPSATWAPGDLYVGLMTGQAVTVNGITYPLSLITFQGRVSREANLAALTAAQAIRDAMKLAPGAGDPDAGSVDSDLDTLQLLAAPQAIRDAMKLAPSGGTPAGRSVDQELDDLLAAIGTAGAGLTTLGDTRLANLDATVSSRAATGADADTLETLSDQIDLIALANVVNGVFARVVEGTVTFEQGFRLIMSKLFGDWDKVGSVVTYNDIADAKARITETLTATGRDVTALDGT